jgi:hypothetical protein
MAMELKRGLLPPRPGAVKLLFSAYLDRAALPKRPDQFGHDSLVSEWHMLGNDRAGCCAWSGAAHETYLWTAMGSERVHITTQDVIDDYAACTGYVPGDPSTDQGTDMQKAAAYRQKIGTRDSRAARHKIAAYVSVDPKSLDDVLTAAWLFGSCALGVTVGESSERQFEFGEPWDGAPGPRAGGHYVPLVGRRGGLNYVVTWGRLQAVTDAFLMANLDQALAYLSPEMLRNGKSLEGFDLAALQSDLEALTH